MALSTTLALVERGDAVAHGVEQGVAARAEIRRCQLGAIAGSHVVAMVSIDCRSKVMRRRWPHVLSSFTQ
jgi:hypothetical protein